MFHSVRMFFPVDPTRARPAAVRLSNLSPRVRTVLFPLTSLGSGFLILTASVLRGPIAKFFAREGPSLSFVESLLIILLSSHLLLFFFVESDLDHYLVQ